MFQIEIHDKNGNPKQRFPHIRSFIIGRYHCEGTEWLVELKLTHSSGEEFPVMLSDYDRFAIVTQLENEAAADAKLAVFKLMLNTTLNLQNTKRDSSAYAKTAGMVEGMTSVLQLLGLSDEYAVYERKELTKQNY